MDMKSKLKETLQNKLDNLINKYFQASLKLENKTMEIIKQFNTEFEGTVEDFFATHTVVSQSCPPNKYYDTTKKMFVDYDIIYKSFAIGVVFDDTGKTVYNKIKLTKEYLELMFYERLIEMITLDLNKDFVCEQNMAPIAPISQEITKDESNPIKL